MKAMIDGVLAREGRLDILHNNVGASLALGDGRATGHHEGGVRPQLRRQPRGHVARPASTRCRRCARSAGSIVNICLDGGGGADTRTSATR